MTFASAQLYLRDIETIRGMPICGNRSDVQNWNVRIPNRNKNIKFMFLGICLFSFYFSLSCSIDCYDCVIYYYYCNNMEKRVC